MQNPNIVFIGMDNHKEYSSTSYLLDGYGQEPVYYGQIKSTKAALTKLLRQLQSKFPNSTLHFVYEAGPCGYWMYRSIERASHLFNVGLKQNILKKRSFV